MFSARLALRRDVIDRGHRDADAVGVDEPLVDPARGARVLVEGQLASREHDLRQLAVDLVAVRVDVEEVVVLADRLELVEGVAERPVVPEPGVVERVLVLLDRGRRQAADRRGRCCAQVFRSKASRVIAMLFAMYGDSRVSWFGMTVMRWTISG